LACSKCGSPRVFVRGNLKCISCDKIELVTDDYLKKLESRIAEVEHTFGLLIRHCDYSETLQLATGLREEAARYLVDDPLARGHAQVWAACSLIIRRLRSDTSPDSVTIQELLEVCKGLVELCNERAAIQGHMMVVVRGEGGLCPTETEPVGQAAKSVNEYLAGQMVGGMKETKEFLEEFGGELESIAFRSEMVGARSFVLSETISRAFKLATHERLLPQFKDSQAASYYHSIALNTASSVAVMLGRDFNRVSGLMIVDDRQFNLLKSSMVGTYSKEAADDFFGVSPHSEVGFECLGNTIFPTDVIRGFHYVPYHSLIMLATVAYRLCKFPEVGQAGNLKGNLMERVIYGAMTGVLRTTHPENGEKLQGYELPAPHGDIDIGAYSDTTFVVVESKFWDAPSLASLEEELAKFERRINYLKANPLWKGAERLRSEERRVGKECRSRWSPYP